MSEEHSNLRRLPDEFYQGDAFVHWILTVDQRKTGWLIPIFFYRFRELLTHTMFRYSITCPIFVCMPDHFHLLWLGLADDSDQKVAMKYFRKHLNDALGKMGFQLQRQPFEHVLHEGERERGAFENAADYIARNPERKGLVQIDGYGTYRFTGCLVPGYPELKPFEKDYWDRFWRTYSYLRSHGIVRGMNKPM
jgi:putative transposase